MCTSIFNWKSMMVLLCTLLASGCASQRSKAVTTQGPNSAAGLAEIGLVFESQGKTSQAIECFEKSLELEPSNHLLQRKIATLKGRPKSSGEREAVASVKDVFRRYEEAKHFEVEARHLNNPAEKHIFASHSSVEQGEDDDFNVGAQSALPENESHLNDWGR